MLLQEAPPPTEPQSIDEIFTELVDGIIGAIPRVITGILFVIIAYFLIRITLRVVRRVFDRTFPRGQDLVVDLSVTVVGIFLWFAVLLGLLKILGLGDVAASLGTASGFIGLGVAFALREMIADTVAGVYLLRDPDFNPGDTVDTASVKGTIVAIDLRKTRIREEDGDLVVVANRDVEKKWTNESVDGESGVASPAADG